MTGILVTGTASVLCCGLFLLFFSRDRSRYRNCCLLFLVILSLFFLMIQALGTHARTVLKALAWISLCIPPLLILNGIKMVRREGRQLRQMLSLLLGISLLGGMLLAFACLHGQVPQDRQTGAYSVRFLAGLALCVTMAYGMLSLAAFMIYTLLLQLIPRKKDFDYVIIHGSGLLDGQRVPKLLRDRLDKGIEVYRKDPSPPILIPTGGQGKNETVPEAEAMKGYLLSQGIPESHIIAESTSTSTLENLVNAQKILNGFEGRKYTALVTSNYHVYRAMRYARQIGLECTGIGSHIALYFWPSGVIREYIAIHAEPRHALLLLLGWALSLAAVFLVLMF